ncbi:thiamine pyrophosphate-binding protein [Algicella marina]|uniref:Thiamine pyrophosphate-binding protein n=1 Tax=Algicella marina TaxID=2683284 RepID=A0A6P1T565_9RHOB|nr:thiamine pyrophosphate-binding protein [Algicella marina]QHQ36895.1 thiamine pyrophosphate-binding protein [Algicella marina]
MNGADVIGRALASAGATHAFGIPGGEVLALIEGLDRSGISFVLTKHENAAGFMAEGLWHATGAPGVLIATLGPGVANAVNVVANAMQDRVPLIFLTGCVDEVDAHTYTHQVFDHQAMLRPIVKASYRAPEGAVSVIIRKAIELALEGQPGPVHVDVPISVAEGAERIRTSGSFRQSVSHVSADTDLMTTCRDRLAASQRPLAIVGVDALNQGAAADVAAFCKRQSIPLITTYKAKGILAETHSLALGGAGLSPKADQLLMPLIRASDCILLLGYDPIEMRIGWREPWSEEQCVIEIADVLRTHGMHDAVFTLRGSVAPTLHLLNEGLEPIDRWPGGEIDSTRRQLAELFKPKGWGPAAVFATLRDVMPENTVITADSGAHRILLSHVWQCSAPRQMLQSTALCTMACAVPLAMGYRIGNADVPVVAFVGDAGLEMGLGELATLRDLKVPLIITVLVDESLALIEMKQRGSQRANLGVDFGGTNFPAVASALGGTGVWIDNEDTLRNEAKLALQRDGFTVLACRIDRHAYDGTF